MDLLIISVFSAVVVLVSAAIYSHRKAEQELAQLQKVKEARLNYRSNPEYVKQ